MNYLEQIAEQIKRQLPADQLPDGDSSALFLEYAVLTLAKGVSVTNEDVHNAWVAWMSTRDSEHESLIPYSHLPSDTKAEDSAFTVAIRKVAATKPV